MLIFRQQTAVLLTVLVLIVFAPLASAQDTDGDGLHDLIDATGFDPGASGTVEFVRVIEDLDGANLLTNVARLDLDFNQITSIESGDFEGLSNLQELDLDSNQIASIESGTSRDSPTCNTFSCMRTKSRASKAGALRDSTPWKGLTLNSTKSRASRAGTSRDSTPWKGLT